MGGGLATSPGMQGLKSLIRMAGVAVAVAALLLGGVGCTSHVSNLTPTGLPQEASGLYHFETEWVTTQRTVGMRASDIKAYVVIDEQMHPMQRVPNMTNRWEADVLLPKGKNPIYYYYKWDYPTAGWGGRDNPNSRRSQPYRLELNEPLK
jgi:hypothetical protein